MNELTHFKYRLVDRTFLARFLTDISEVPVTDSNCEIKLEEWATFKHIEKHMEWASNNELNIYCVTARYKGRKLRSYQTVSSLVIEDAVMSLADLLKVNILNWAKENYDNDS